MDLKPILEEVYAKCCAAQSDINEHLPVLKEYASKCEHVTEFGVRDCVSTWAFLAGFPKKFICYDIIESPQVENAKKLAESCGIDFSFHKKNVTEIAIEPTDLLFIDTFHCYGQLKSELALHANKVKKYLIFHDTSTFGYRDEDYFADHLNKFTGEFAKCTGLMPAIDEFLAGNPSWKVTRVFHNNNGLTVLEKS